MRPVDRGACPRAATGEPQQFSAYGHARPHLIDRMGAYCSFCEVEMSTPIAVEHIRHKDNNPDLEQSWDNLLLACVNCNSNKGTKVDTEADVRARLWPHLDRTFDAFDYRPDGIVQLAAVADAAERARAQMLADTVGLFKRPGHGLTPDQITRGSDRRYQVRATAWRQAVDARDDLAHLDHPRMRKRIVAEAVSTGFWSVWMTVFADDPAMRADLCRAFTGTAIQRVDPRPAAPGADENDHPR